MRTTISALLISTILATTGLGCSGETRLNGQRAESDGSAPNNENTHAACADSADNDGDGKIDCDDPDCQGRAFCSFAGDGGSNATPPDALANCGGSHFQANPIKPNVLFLLDRSTSMVIDPFNDAQGRTKWDVARQALSVMAKEHASAMRIGLGVYPGNRRTCSLRVICDVGAVMLELGTDANTLEGALGDQPGAIEVCPDSSTPIAATLHALLSYQGLADSTRPNFIVLVTDGKDLCFPEYAPTAFLLGQAVKRHRQRTPSVKTFVLGFGNAVDPEQLDAMAQEGGEARPSGVPYYMAENAEDLDRALEEIVGEVTLPCALGLDRTPPEDSEISVFIDGNKVPESEQKGWTYDSQHNQLKLHGSACSRLSSGNAPKVDVAFGCTTTVY